MVWVLLLLLVGVMIGIGLSRWLALVYRGWATSRVVGVPLLVPALVATASLSLLDAQLSELRLSSNVDLLLVVGLMGLVTLVVGIIAWGVLVMTDRVLEGEPEDILDVRRDHDGMSCAVEAPPYTKLHAAGFLFLFGLVVLGVEIAVFSVGWPGLLGVLLLGGVAWLQLRTRPSSRASRLRIQSDKLVLPDGTEIPLGGIDDVSISYGAIECEWGGRAYRLCPAVSEAHLDWLYEQVADTWNVAREKGPVEPEAEPSALRALRERA